MVVEFINQLTTGRDHLVSWGYDGDIIGMILIIGSMPSGNQTNLKKTNVAIEQRRSKSMV